MMERLLINDGKTGNRRVAQRKPLFMTDRPLYDSEYLELNGDIQRNPGKKWQKAKKLTLNSKKTFLAL